MSDPGEIGATRPPSGGFERLQRLAEDLQALAVALREEWLRTDEARQALAQVLAEREDQRDVAQRRLADAEARLTDLEAQRATLEKRASEAEQAAEGARASTQEEQAALEKQLADERARAEERSQALARLESEREGERARAQEDHAALEKQLADERTRAEELAARLAQQETTTAPDPASAGRLAELEAEHEAERSRAQEERAALEKQLAEEQGRSGELADKLGAASRSLSEEREGFERERQALTVERNDARQAAVAADELRTRAEQAAREVQELRLQVEGLMRQADGERAAWQQERSGIAAERYKALSEAAQLRARVEELEARGAPAAEPPARDERAALAQELDAARQRSAQLEQELAESRGGLATHEAQLAQLSDEVATLKAERSLLNEKLDTAEQARQAAEAERERAKAETSPLWGTIESLQRQIQIEREEAQARQANAPGEATLRGNLDQLRGEVAERTRDLEESGRRALDAEAALRSLRERWEALQKPLHNALAAWHRTPFVPPTLKVWLDAVSEHLESEAAPKRGPRATRLLLLDRDPLSVEPLAHDLEQRGAEVLVAHYADEAALFVKTPEARTLTALMADVMAFKSDQDMVERFKAWRHDLPQLVLLVSYRADNAVEAGRARQLPGNLQAVNVARTIGGEALLEVLARRPAPKPPEGGAGVFKLFKR